MEKEIDIPTFDELCISNIKSLENTKETLNKNIDLLNDIESKLMTLDITEEEKENNKLKVKLITGRTDNISGSIEKMSKTLAKIIDQEQKIYRQNTKLMNIGKEEETEEDDFDYKNKELSCTEKEAIKKEVTDNHIREIIKNINFRLGIKGMDNSAINDWIEEWMDDWLNEGFRERIELSKSQETEWVMPACGPNPMTVKGTMNGENQDNFPKNYEKNLKHIKSEEITSLAEKHPLDIEIITNKNREELGVNDNKSEEVKEKG